MNNHQDRRLRVEPWQGAKKRVWQVKWSWCVSTWFGGEVRAGNKKKTEPKQTGLAQTFWFFFMGGGGQWKNQEGRCSIRLPRWGFKWCKLKIMTKGTIGNKRRETAHQTNLAFGLELNLYSTWPDQVHNLVWDVKKEMWVKCFIMKSSCFSLKRSLLLLSIEFIFSHRSQINIVLHCCWFFFFAIVVLYACPVREVVKVWSSLISAISPQQGSKAFLDLSWYLFTKNRNQSLFLQ